MSRGPGRPAHPVTEEDCHRWLREQLEDVTRGYHEQLEHVRRARAACDIVEDVAAVYAGVAAGIYPWDRQASLIDDAFMRRHIVIAPEQLHAMDVPKMQVKDESALRLAMVHVSLATGVSQHALRAQRSFRAREKREDAGVVDTLEAARVLRRVNG